MTVMTAQPATHPAARNRPQPQHTARGADDPPRDRCHLTLQAFLETAGLCRIMADLTAWQWGADRDDAATIASELAANAIRATLDAHTQARQHAAEQHAPVPAALPVIGYRLTRLDGQMRIEVWDTAPGYPVMTAQPDFEAETGRGLFLVHTLSAGNWASYPTPDERAPGQPKCVWAEIPINPGS